jgi:hypothetical protein
MGYFPPQRYLYLVSLTLNSFSFKSPHRLARFEEWKRDTTALTISLANDMLSIVTWS